MDKRGCGVDKCVGYVSSVDGVDKCEGGMSEWCG